MSDDERATLAPAHDYSRSVKASTSILPCLFLTAILAAAAVVAGVAGMALSTARFALQPVMAGAAAVPVTGAAAAAPTRSPADEKAEYICTTASETPDSPASGAWVVRDIRRVRSVGGRPVADAQPLTWADAITALISGSLGPFLDAKIVHSPHQPALYWETPPLSASLQYRPFEFVTLPARHLDRTPADGTPFAEHFRDAAPCGTATFTNLGGDSTLVAPCPPQAGNLYTPSHAHLGAFTRLATPAQRDALWRAVGSAAQSAAKREAPTWISTEGSGVAWLHVRLDSRPKYYHYARYRLARGDAANAAGTRW